MANDWYEERDPLSPIVYRYRDARVLHQRRSAFQDIKVLESGFFGRMLALDDVVQLTQRDEFLYHEMLAHVPLHAHPNPERVLIVGGGDGGTLREVLKHPSVGHVKLVELDAEVIEVAKAYLPDLAGSFASPRVELHVGDGAQYLTETQEHIDVILVDSTDPVGQAAKLFYRGFFAAARKVLRKGGIIAVQSESLHYHANHVRQVQDELSSVFASVALYGTSIATYAGNWWTFSMASDEALPHEPVRPPVTGTRVYDAEVHRSAFVSRRVLDCFTAAEADFVQSPARVHSYTSAE